MKKKGQAISGVQSLIAPLVGIGIILAIGFLILAQVKTQAVDQGVSTNTINESVTGASINTYKALTHSTHAMAVNCLAVWNSTNNVTQYAKLPTTGYTCDVHGLNVSDAGANFTLFYVTYTYKNMTSAWNGTGVTQGAMADIPGWLPIIIVTVIGAILLMLVAMFRRSSS